MNKEYELYQQIMQRIADIGNAGAVLNWDQETHMPVNGSKLRSQQLATLAGLQHELATSKELGGLLNNLSNNTDLSIKEQKNITLSLKDYTKQKKYDQAFVEEMSKAVSNCFIAWQEAKKKNDYSIFSPEFEKLINLKREESEILGYENHPYDAHLDIYEPGTNTAMLDTLFADVREQLVELVKEINTSNTPEDGFMYHSYEQSKQWDFGIVLLKQMGYDFNSGRQDLSTHPFTTSFNANDVRVTTRISENNIHEMIWSCIHEGGHALYEQGLPLSEYGLPSGEAISLSIHESQSRLWENNVGRSYSYWKHNFPFLQKTFPEGLKGVDVEAFHKAMNLVKPSLVRTAADELTYHFHIMVRYELEKLIFENKVQVKDLPSIWNDKYKEYLGLDVPNDGEGILQDIHWSHGSFGYFPTYSLGSFYAAQFYDTIEKEIPDLKSKIEDGDLSTLLTWLRKNIHVHGRTYNSEELCKKITGEGLNFSYFMNYAIKKYGKLYNLKQSVES